MPTPDPTHLWQWMLSAGVVLWMCKIVLDIWRAHIRTPDPVPPLHEHYATKAEHRELRSDVQTLADKTDQRFAAIAAAASQSREKIYTGVRELEQSVSALREKSDGQSAQLDRLDTKIDRLLFTKGPSHD